MQLQSPWRHRALLGLLLIGLIALLSWWFFPQKWLLVVAVVAFGILFVGVVGLVVMELPGWLVARDARRNPEEKPLTSDQRLTAVSSARSTMVQGIVGLLALGGIAVAWQQLNLQEGWWRLFRRQAPAGQCFADSGSFMTARLTP
jgi:hypothetical protein